jgi:leucyl/phenylalanyl-tRNA---protein transferase
MTSAGPPLSPSLVLNAYRAGLFPMAESRDGEISWYSPDPRAIIPLDRFTTPRSLRQLISRRAFEIRVDTAFADVISACAERDETWISGEIISTYTGLHALGYAHSVEAWHNGVLAGGLYGVAIGGAFFGESMFTRVSGASKVALVALVGRLRERGFHLLDSQFVNPHLLQFGIMEIPKSEYLELLSEAVLVQTTF